MSKRAPSYVLAESGYTIQLRPLATHKDDAEAGKQHYALCLWRDNGIIRQEICGISGFVIPIVWHEEEGHPDLFLAAKRLLLTSPETSKRPAEMNPFHKGHVRWLADTKEMAKFDAAVNDRIDGTAPAARGGSIPTS